MVKFFVSLEKHKNTISLQQYDWSPQNLQRWCRTCLLSALAVKYIIFKNRDCGQLLHLRDSFYTVPKNILQLLKECNKLSVRWKSFAFHKLVWWHFQVGWASGLELVFFWVNVNNQKHVWIILLKILWLFWISQGKVGTSDRWGGQICKISVLNCLRI